MNKLLNRKSLKQLFQNGSRPAEEDFGNLINSMLNVVDDGISKNAADGLILAPEGKDSEKVMSLYESFQQPEPDWSIELGATENRGFTINEPQTSGAPNPRLFLKKGGNIGVETDEPISTLHVNGILGTNARMGTFLTGTIPADGSWHQVIGKQDGCVAYEIVAQVGKVATGKYALAKTTAVSTFGKSKINSTQAHYGFCWNKIAFRFRGDIHNYALQMKTRSNYGTGQVVKFHISKLWDENIEKLIK